MLSSLYFGKDDAETDIGRAGLLAEGFLETSAYQNALSGDKWLFLGRKGSGKSAICLKIHKSISSNKASSLITPDEISSDEIKRFELGGIAPYQAKELLWRYIFCIQLSKLMIQYLDRHPNVYAPDIKDKLRRFLLDNGEAGDLTALERFWRIVERLKTTLKVTALDTIEASVTYEPSSGARLSDQVDVIESKLIEYAVSTGMTVNRNTFYLLIDQIEKIWSNDSGSDTLVIGLLRAAKHFQSKFDFVNCSVFLRIDIYEKLDFKERDKLRGDEFPIRWDRSRLIDLIEARAVASMGAKFSAAGLWTHVFPRKIGDIDTKKYLTSLTLNRPRDIIQLCNACRDIARSRGKSKIQERDVVAAAKQYSRWKLLDIQNEWSLNYPFLSDALLLISNGSYLFSRKDFNRKYESVEGDFTTRYPSSQSVLSADYLLSVFFAISVVGVIRDEQSMYFCNADFDDNLSIQDDNFAIHPCFREALQCNSAIDLPPFEESNVIQLETVRGRIRRGAQGIGIEESDSPTRSLIKEAKFNIENILRSIPELDITSEIKDELRINIFRVRNEMDTLENSFDEVEQRDALEKIASFLRVLQRNLIRKELISAKHDIFYRLEDAAYLFDEIAYGSRRRRYRS